MLKIFSRSLAIAATLTLGVGAVASSARADLVRVVTSPAVMPLQSTVVMPTSTLIQPGFTVRTTRQTIFPAPPATVTTRTYELPAVIHQVGSEVVPSAVITPSATTTTIIGPGSTLVPTGTVTSTSSVTETKVSQPDPMGRLRAMGDQINLGVSKGLLKTGDEAILRNEFTRLQAVIEADLMDGLTTAENNDLEKQLTVFQQQISNAMR